MAFLQGGRNSLTTSSEHVVASGNPPRPKIIGNRFQISENGIWSCSLCINKNYHIAGSARRHWKKIHQEKFEQDKKIRAEFRQEKAKEKDDKLEAKRKHMALIAESFDVLEKGGYKCKKCPNGYHKEWINAMRHYTRVHNIPTVMCPLLASGDCEVKEIFRKSHAVRSHWDSSHYNLPRIMVQDILQKLNPNGTIAKTEDKWFADCPIIMTQDYKLHSDEKKCGHNFYLEKLNHLILMNDTWLRFDCVLCRRCFPTKIEGERHIQFHLKNGVWCPLQKLSCKLCKCLEEWVAPENLIGHWMEDHPIFARELARNALLLLSNGEIPPEVEMWLVGNVYISPYHLGSSPHSANTIPLPTLPASIEWSTEPITPSKRDSIFDSLHQLTTIEDECSPGKRRKHGGLDVLCDPDASRQRNKEQFLPSPG